MNSSPNSSSESDNTTNFRMVNRVKTAPLSVMGYPYLGMKPRKKFPNAQRLAILAERYDASKLMFNIMYDAWILIVESGFVARYSNTSFVILSVVFVAFTCLLVMMERATRTVQYNVCKYYRMLLKTCWIFVVSSLVVGGAVLSGIGSWDATPYLQEAVG